MIIYAESNFVLELSLAQEESAFAEEILGLAEAGFIELAIPSFALSEPFSSTARRGNSRNALQESMLQQLRELKRSGLHREIATRLNEAMIDFFAATDKEMALLEVTLDRILKVSTVVPITSVIFSEARLYRSRFGISAQDAVIYASVISDLRRRRMEEEKRFVSRNYRDFEDPGMDQELLVLNCRYIPRFRDAVGFIKSRLPVGDA